MLTERLSPHYRAALTLPRPLPAVTRSIAVDITSYLFTTREDGQFRVFYFVESSQGIPVMHAFVKKTRATAPSEIQVARKRLKDMLDG